MSKFKKGQKLSLVEIRQFEQEKEKERQKKEAEKANAKA